MMDQLGPQIGSKQGFQRSVTKLRGTSLPRVSMYIKAMIVIVGALMALAI